MQPIMKALAWTFVHSLWQGLLAALLAAVIISVTRKSKAVLRYNLLGIVLVLFLAIVVTSFLGRYQPAQYSEIQSVSSPAVLAIHGNDSLRGIDDNTTVIIAGGFITDLTNWLDNNSSLLILIWAFFFLINCLKLFTGLATVNRLRHYKTHPVTDDWKLKLEHWRFRLGIRRSISLLQSELVKVPVALGYLKPVILLPVGLLANIPPEQVEAILLHELGHIRRKDYLVNLLQRFAESIFFFNPAILWISSLLRQEREACCDDIVVAKTGQTRNYLNALVSFQEYSLTHNFYAMGISSRRQHLLERVKRILTNENKKLNLVEKAALLSGVIFLFAFSYIQEKETKKVLVNTPAAHYTTYNAMTDTVPVTTKVPAISDSTSKRLPIEKEWKIASEKEDKTMEKEWNATIEKKWNTTIEKDWKPVIEKDWNTTIEKEWKPVIEKDWKPVIENDWNTILEKDWKPAIEKDWKVNKEEGWENDTTGIKKVLQEIEELKNQIGIQKESIGVKKEKLGALRGKNAIEEKALKHEIDKERGELDGQRKVLEEKRLLLEKLRIKSEVKKQQGKISKPKTAKDKVAPDSGAGAGAGSGADRAGEGSRTEPARPKIKTIQVPVNL